jgi:hypothetical protein
MEPESSLPCSQQPATGSIPSQMKKVHLLLLYSSKVYFNIILPSMPTPSQSFLSFRVFYQDFVWSSPP